MPHELLVVLALFGASLILYSSSTDTLNLERTKLSSLQRPTEVKWSSPNRKSSLPSPAEWFMTVGRDDESLRSLANRASSNLSALFNTATQYQYYQKKYQCSLNPMKFRKDECLQPVDPVRPDRPPLEAWLVKRTGSELAQQLASYLQDEIVKKIRAVKTSARAAEQAFIDYQLTELSDDIAFFNAKTVNQQATDENPYQNLPVRYDTHFKANVNLTHSAVQVPTKVDAASDEINNGARWTKRLNEVFSANRERDLNLFWQYFGSSKGFYRFYPGSKWVTSELKTDDFDCRAKDWYIQGTSSAKDVVILLDASGSMQGGRFEIAIETVDQILKTLSNNDFFNIMFFNQDVDYADQCFADTLIQATAENKQRLRREIRNIDTRGNANFDQALTKAFSLFNKTIIDDIGGMCNRAIMLITGGASDTYDHIFDRYNNPHNVPMGLSQVRVFGFVIGRDNTQLKTMSCRNKGHYVEIEAKADAEDNVKQYLSTLAKPLALSDFNDVKWTGTYINDAGYNYVIKKKAGESLVKDNNPDMRLMTSVTAPVFNRKPDSAQQDLLGVVGTDLPIYYLQNYLPPSMLGVGTYVFATDNNGFVLFHPDYVTPFDAPEFTSIDVVKLERKFSPWDLYDKIHQAYNGPIPTVLPNGTETTLAVNENDTDAATERVIALLNKVSAAVPDYKNKLRHSMVRAYTGHDWMTALKTADKNARPKVAGMHYFYTRVPYTPFTLGVAIPGERTRMYDYGFVQMNGRIDVRNADMTVLESRDDLQTKIPSQWNYCRMTATELEVTSADYEVQLEEIYRKFEQNYNDSDKPPKGLPMEPRFPPRIYCRELKRRFLETCFIKSVNSTSEYNETAIKISNSTYPAIEKITALNDQNETVDHYRFNESRCMKLVKDVHVQAISDKQAWMFEKKFQQQLLRYIALGKENAPKFQTHCNAEIIESVLFDAEITNDTSAKLSTAHSQFVSMAFIATRSGLTRYVTSDNSESEFINKHSETIRETYYERAVEAGSDNILVTFNKIFKYPPRVILAQPVFVKHATRDGNEGQTAVAVAGLEMSAIDLGSLVFSQPCDKDGRMCNVQCGSSSTCYLLDDSGYVVYTEDHENIGRSMADVDPNLFIQLTNYDEMIGTGPTAKKKENGPVTWASLYEMILFDDYQTICPIFEEKTAGALRLLNPFTRVLRFFVTFTFHLTWFAVQIVMVSLAAVVTTIREIGARRLYEAPPECKRPFDDGRTEEFWDCASRLTEFSAEKPNFSGNTVCTKRYNVYRLNQKATRLSGQLTEKCHDCTTCKYVSKDNTCFSCSGERNGTTLSNLTSDDMPACTKKWRAQLLPKTNLVMLVADRSCKCPVDQSVVRILEDKTPKYASDDEQCEMLKVPHSRRLPKVCAMHHPSETVDACSGSA